MMSRSPGCSLGITTLGKRPALCALLSAMSLVLQGCTPIREEAYASAFSRSLLERFFELRAQKQPLANQDRLKSSPTAQGWALSADEVPLDTILRDLDPSIALNSIPREWIGKKVSIDLQGDSRETCLRDLQDRYGPLLGPKIEPVSASAANSFSQSIPKVTRTIQLLHASVSNVQQGLQQGFLSGSSNIQIAFGTETNQVFVRGAPADVERITRLIEELDERPATVQVDAWIAASRETEDLYFEPLPILQKSPVELSLAGGGGTQGDLDWRNGLNRIGVWKIAPFRGPFTENSLSLSAQLLNIQYLLSRSRKTALTAPSLLCVSGEDAALKIGRTGYRLYVTPTSLTSSTISNQPIDASTTLSITPKVMDSNLIELTINLQLNSFSTDTTLIANTTSRGFKGVVRVAPGDVIQIGGLEKPSWSLSSQGQTGARLMPVLQWLTRSSDEVASSDEFAFYLTVQIVEPGRLGSCIPPEVLRLGEIVSEELQEKI
jgi:hypothetical protein